MRRRLIFFAPLALAGAALFVFAGGEVVKALWNWLTPELFGWRPITFWQALGLLVLCRILFGGLGRHGVPRMSHRMTPDERDHFRQRLRERWGWGGGGAPSDVLGAGGRGVPPEARGAGGRGVPPEARGAGEGGNML